MDGGRFLSSRFSPPARITSSSRLISLSPASSRGTAAEAYEQGMRERILIAEFPSLEKAIAAYHRPAYKEALNLGDGAARGVRIVEGLE
jgi:hypothetical protein